MTRGGLFIDGGMEAGGMSDDLTFEQKCTLAWYAQHGVKPGDTVTVRNADGAIYTGTLQPNGDLRGAVDWRTADDGTATDAAQEDRD